MVSKSKKLEIKPYCLYCKYFGEVKNHMAICSKYGYKRPPNNRSCKYGFEADLIKHNKYINQ